MKRLEALDEFRGLTVVLLIIFMPIWMFTEVPSYLKHAAGNGFTIVDLIVPLFLFAVGLSFQVSLANRLNRATKMEAVKHYFYRSLIFIGFGLLGELVKHRDLQLHWGVLEMIGLSSLVALPFMFLVGSRRLAIAAIFIFLWQLFLSLGYDSVALRYDLGGPLSSIAWSSVILVASALMENKTEVDFFINSIIIGASFYLTSNIATIFWPVNKHLVTLTYLNLTIAISITTFFFFRLKEEFYVSRILSSFGRNALLFYVVAGLTSFLIENTLSPALRWYSVLVLVLVILFLDSTLAKFLDAKKIYWKI